MVDATCSLRMSLAYRIASRNVTLFPKETTFAFSAGQEIRKRNRQKNGTIAENDRDVVVYVDGVECVQRQSALRVQVNVVYRLNQNGASRTLHMTLSMSLYGMNHFVSACFIHEFLPSKIQVETPKRH